MWRRTLSHLARPGAVSSSRLPVPRNAALYLPFRFDVLDVWAAFRDHAVHPAFRHHDYRTDRWDHVFNASDLASSFASLGPIQPFHGVMRGHIEKDRTVVAPPLWLVLRLLRDKVHSAQDARSASNIVLGHLSLFPRAVKPCVIALTTFWSIKYNDVSSTELLVTAFLNLHPHPVALHYFLLLHILATADREPQNARRVERVLDAALECGHRMPPSVFSRLLRPQFATPVLAKHVYQQMDAHNYALTENNLQHLLAIYNRARRQKDAQEILRVMKSRGIAERDPQEQSHAALSSFPENTQNEERNGPEDSMPEEDDSLDEAPDAERQTVTPPLVHAHSRPEEMRRLRHGFDIALSDMQSLSHDPRKSVKDIINLFQQIFDPKLVNTFRGRRLDVAFMAALMEKRAYNEVLAHFDTVRSGDTRFSERPALIAIRALIMTDRPAPALDLLEQLLKTRDPRKQDMANPRLPARIVRGQAVVHSITSRNVTEVMRSLLKKGHLDAVYVMWDNFEDLYGSSPSEFTLETVMEAARLSAKHANTVRGAVAQLGFASFMQRPSWSPEDDIVDLRERTVARLRRIVSQPPQHLGMWRGEAAHRAALRLVTTVLLENNPHLRYVESPVRALRQSQNDLIHNAMSELQHAMTQYTKVQKAPPHASRLLSLAPPPSTTQSYPGIVPHASLFKIFIHLLAANDFCDDIPLVFAWMRALDLTPAMRTIARGLVYYRPVGSDAPMVEQMRGGSKQSPYGLLVRWLEDWLGKDAMPTDALVGEQMRAIDRFSRSNAEDFSPLSRRRSPNSPARRELS
ncbi:hypothetical protein EIP91_000476 [Steccherinum ochraceum]|uniref:Uncharacterized protein n=1 Tax=Steccherinum ochraceum TaxID=92696 RepID=A0A4R0RI56_9APHY|nr:hypothetical protein EIP91_000476 [Steccherinum ochraceum]